MLILGFLSSGLSVFLAAFVFCLPLPYIHLLGIKSTEILARNYSIRTKMCNPKIRKISITQVKITPKFISRLIHFNSFTT